MNIFTFNKKFQNKILQFFLKKFCLKVSFEFYSPPSLTYLFPSFFSFMWNKGANSERKCECVCVCARTCKGVGGVELLKTFPSESNKKVSFFSITITHFTLFQLFFSGEKINNAKRCFFLTFCLFSDFPPFFPVKIFIRKFQPAQFLSLCKNLCPQCLVSLVT